MRVLSLKKFFLPLGSRYQNFNSAFFAEVTAESIGALKPVISLNTMQGTARVEKNGFSEKIVGFPFFDSPLFLPPQMLRCISIALGRTSKTPISDLPYLLQF